MSCQLVSLGAVYVTAFVSAGALLQICRVNLLPGLNKKRVIVLVVFLVVPDFFASLRIWFCCAVYRSSLWTVNIAAKRGLALRFKSCRKNLCFIIISWEEEDHFEN